MFSCWNDSLLHAYGSSVLTSWLSSVEIAVLQIVALIICIVCALAFHALTVYGLSRQPEQLEVSNLSVH